MDVLVPIGVVNAVATVICIAMGEFLGAAIMATLTVLFLGVAFRGRGRGSTR